MIDLQRFMSTTQWNRIECETDIPSLQENKSCLDILYYIHNSHYKNANFPLQLTYDIWLKRTLDSVHKSLDNWFLETCPFATIKENKVEMFEK
jgi:hypothetical protein